MKKYTIEEVREEANHYIKKNLELFNQEPTYSQVIGFVVKPILADYDSAQKKIEAQGRAIEKIKEQRDRYASGVSSRDELEQMNQEISVILNTQEDSK